jgi:diguanylate cyclase (GGDEF)-like protein/PAS domain S-box-containing protein
MNIRAVYQRLFRSAITYWQHSIRRQLTFGYGVSTLLLMLAAGYVLHHQQHEVLYREGIERATSVAGALARSSGSWVTSNNMEDLQESVTALNDTLDFKNVLVFALDGKVLGSTHLEDVGSMVSDPLSLGLLKSPPDKHVFADQRQLIGIALPVLDSGHYLGWVRLEMSRESANADLLLLDRIWLGFALLAVLVVTVVTYLLSRSLTQGLVQLMGVTSQVASGNREARAIILREDEVGILSRNFNSMLDSLHESDLRFRQLAENIGEVFWMTEPDRQKILYVSFAYELIWGRSVQSLLNIPRSWLDSVHPEDKKRVSMAMARQAEYPYDEEYRIVRSDGQIRWIHDRAFQILDNTGKVYRVVGIAKDVTERKRHENQIIENEQRLLDILNISPIAVRIAIKQGREVVFYNSRYADLIKNIHAMGDDPRNYYVRLEDYEEVLEELAKGKTVVNRQLELRIPNGTTAWTLASYMPMQYQGEAAILGWFYDITDQKAAEKEIRTLAFFDHLTRLPNRQLLMDRLQQALASSGRSGRQGALLFIDMDNFKSLNDTLGHNIGDLLLQQIAERLLLCVREGDSVARLGGDEFVVMLEELSEHALDAASQTEVVGEKILAALSQPYQLAVHEYHITTSIGMTLFNGHQQTMDELLKQADIAMYQSKKAGRNTLRFFDRQMQDVINSHVALEHELRHALESSQLQLYYQIQVDSSSRPLGAEALIRWVHPERGLIFPAQFIPLAEESGMILSIGKWVLNTACIQLKNWQQNELTRDLTLAVNVSAKQFRQADFVDQVQAVIKAHAINPRLLKLELTESLLLENIESTIATMTELHKLGVRFSLDDFGTGYSSLQYLKLLPIDQLKIDQSFVRDITFDSSDRAIVRTIVVMAHSLNLEVIAEGVETDAQRQLLLNKGCAHYQGYVFGKPMPIEQFEALLGNTAMDCFALPLSASE